MAEWLVSKDGKKFMLEGTFSIPFEAKPSEDAYDLVHCPFRQRMAHLSEKYLYIQVTTCGLFIGGVMSSGSLKEEVYYVLAKDNYRIVEKGFCKSVHED